MLYLRERDAVTGSRKTRRCLPYRLQRSVLLCSPLLLVTHMAQSACVMPGTNAADLSGDLSDGVCATAPPTITLNIDNLTADITPAAGDVGVQLLSQGGNGDSGTTLPIHGTNGSGASGGLTLSTSVIDNTYSIATSGDSAHGIYARSRGGTGGTGGNGFGIVIIVPPFIPIWLPGFGGDGGNGGNGGAVTVFNNADISTPDDTAYGIYASSRGGNGGGGGMRALACGRCGCRPLAHAHGRDR